MENDVKAKEKRMEECKINDNEERDEQYTKNDRQDELKEQL